MIKFSNTQFNNLISKYLQIFSNEYFLHPIIGLEIEFYVQEEKHIKLLQKDLTDKKSNCY